MDPFQLTSPLLDYDPEEEERKRIASLAALAAQAGPHKYLPDNGVSEPLTPQLTPPDPTPVEAELYAFAPPEATAALAAQGAPQKRNIADPANAAWLAEETAKFNRNEDGRANPVPHAVTGQMTPPVAAAAVAAPPPPQQDPFEALMRRGEEQRQRALDEYGKNEPSINGWALLADVAFNKGRSIPQMLQQVDNDKRAWREGRTKLLTGGAHNDPVSQMLAMERIKVAQGNLDERGKTNQRLTDKDAAKAAQSEQNREAFLAQLKIMGAPDSELEALKNADEPTFRAFMPSFRERYKITDPTMVEGARNLSREREEGRVEGNIAATHANIDTKAGDAGRVADATYAAQARHLGTKPETPAEKAERERRARLDARQAERDRIQDEHNRSITDRLDQNDRTAFNKDYSTKTDAAVKVAKSVQSLEDALAADPKMFDTENNFAGRLVGFVGGDKAAQRVRGYQIDAERDPEKKKRLQAQIAFRDNYLKAAAFSLKDATGLSGNLNEQDQNTIRTGASPNATIAEMQAGIEIMARDTKDKLAREGVPRPDLADENLIASGLDPERWAPGLASARKKHAAKTAPQPAAAPAMADPELGEGQTEVINENGEAVVDGAGWEGSLDTPKPPTSRKNSNRPARNTNTTQPTNLGVNNGAERIGASAHAQSTAPKREVTITYDDGTQETADLTDMEIARLRGKRGVLEVR